MSARTLRLTWLLLGLPASACGLTSLDPYFECSEGKHCGAPSAAGGASENAGSAGEGGATDAGTGAERGCTVTVECAPGTCWRGVCGSAVELTYRDTPDAGSDASNAKWIKFELTLSNRTPSDIPLSSLEVRYYFTPESVTPELQVLSTTGVPKSNHDVLGTFGRTSNGWAYLALGFTPEAGALPSGARSGVIKVGVHDLDFGPGTFYETDDYSYLEQTRITVYLAGALVSGSEPSVAPAR